MAELNLPPEILPSQLSGNESISSTVSNSSSNVNSNISVNNSAVNSSMSDEPDATVKQVKFEDVYQYDAVCPHDNLHFTSDAAWKQHHHDCHMDTKWKCPLCNTVSASWHNYSYHVQIQEHGMCPPPWICKLRLPAVPTQNKKAHSTVNKDTKSTSKDSTICLKRFGSKYQLVRHIKSEHTNYHLLDVNYI